MLHHSAGQTSALRMLIYLIFFVLLWRLKTTNPFIHLYTHISPHNMDLYGQNPSHIYYNIALQRSQNYFLWQHLSKQPPGTRSNPVQFLVWTDDYHVPIPTQGGCSTHDCLQPDRPCKEITIGELSCRRGCPNSTCRSLSPAFDNVVRLKKAGGRLQKAEDANNPTVQQAIVSHSR